MPATQHHYPLASTTLHCLVTEVQLAHSLYMTGEQLRVEPMAINCLVQHPTDNQDPSHCCC